MTPYRNRDRYYRLPRRPVDPVADRRLLRDIASPARAAALAAQPVRMVTPEEHEAEQQRPVRLASDKPREVVARAVGEMWRMF